MADEQVKTNEPEAQAGAIGPIVEPMIMIGRDANGRCGIHIREGMHFAIAASLLQLWHLRVVEQLNFDRQSKIQLATPGSVPPLVTH